MNLKMNLHILIMCHGVSQDRPRSLRHFTTCKVLVLHWAWLYVFRLHESSPPNTIRYYEINPNCQLHSRLQVSLPRMIRLSCLPQPRLGSPLVGQPHLNASFQSPRWIIDKRTNKIDNDKCRYVIRVSVPAAARGVDVDGLYQGAGDRWCSWSQEPQAVHHHLD